MSYVVIITLFCVNLKVNCRDVYIFLNCSAFVYAKTGHTYSIF